MTNAMTLDSPPAGSSIRTLREARLLSQDLLATSAGVSLSTVTRMERGKPVSPESLKAVCAVLGVDAVAMAANFDRPAAEEASPAFVPPAADTPRDAAGTIAPDEKARSIRSTTTFILFCALCVLAADAGVALGRSVILERAESVIGVFAEFEIRRIAKDINQASALYSKTLPQEHPDRAWDPYARQKPLTWHDCRSPVLWDLVWRQKTHCYTRGIDERVQARDRTATTFVVGPADPSQIRSILSLVTADPTVSFGALVSLSGDVQPERAARTDPRGSDSVPGTPNAEPGYIHLTIGSRP